MVAILSAAFGPLAGCKSEKPASRPAEAPTPAPLKARLGDLSFNSFSQGWGTPQLNLSVSGKPLSIGGQGYQTGLGTHADSRIEVSFPAKYTTFTGSCGIDDEVQEHGSVVFKILDGKKLLFESPLMKGKMKAADFSVPVNGLTGLTLIVDKVDNIDSDHADWVNLDLK
jgi:hypothetical protein